jgi:hypothetical protein
MPDNDNSAITLRSHLEALPTELLEAFFWQSLEFSLCHVSSALRSRLPSFNRLSRFLPMVAFAPKRVLPKIFSSHEGNCSDVIRRLSLHSRLSDEEQVALQRRVLDSGLFNHNAWLGTFFALRDSQVQSVWIHRGYQVVPSDLEAFSERYKHLSGQLNVKGLHRAKTRKVLTFEKLHLLIEDDLEARPDPGFCFFHARDFFRVIEPRCVPESVLTGPLPTTENPICCAICSWWKLYGLPCTQRISSSFVTPPIVTKTTSDQPHLKSFFTCLKE